MGCTAVPLIYLAASPAILGIIWSFFAPLPNWAGFGMGFCTLALGIKVILEGFKFKRPKLVINSHKHRRFLIFAVLFFIVSVTHAWHLTGGGSLYAPGAKYKHYVSATKEGVVFEFKDAASFCLAKRAVDRLACAILLLAVGLFFSLSIKEKDI